MKGPSSGSPQFWRAPLILATLLFVLSSSIFWFEFRKKPDAERARESARKVFDLSKQQAASIRLEFPNGPAVELRCLDIAAGLCRAGETSRWEVTEPLKLKADDTHVQSLLSNLNQLIPNDTISLADEPVEQRPMLLRQYGLESSQRPQAPTVTVTDAEGKSRKLFLGEKHPMGDTLFAIAIEGPEPEQVLLLSSGVREQLNKPVTHWREKRFIPVVASDLKAVRLKQGSSMLEASRTPEGWKLTHRSNGRTEEAPGDIENVDSWISGIVFLTAEEFASEKKSSPQGRRALADSRLVLRIELVAGEQAPFAFELREKGASQLLAVADSLDPVFQLDPGARNRLGKKLGDLQLSKLLASLDRFNARSISLESKALGKDPILLESDPNGSQWKRKDTGAELRPELVSGLLEKLSGNRITRFFPASSKELESAANSGLTLRLSGEKEGQKQAILRELRFWKSGPRLLGQDLKGPEGRILELDSSLAASLPWDAGSLK